MNLKLLKHTQDYIEKMANGINPLTNENVSENDIINNITKEEINQYKY